MTTSAVQRLMKDLRQLEKEEHMAISARPLEGNLFKWHANLVGSESTPYEGAIFHLEIEFPDDYPLRRPSVSIFTPIPHPHVVNDRICLNLLSDYENYFTGETYSNGWSPAYSVSSILLQLHVFLMDIDGDDLPTDQLSAMLQSIPKSIEKTKEFYCETCNHSFYSPWPPLCKSEPVNYDSTGDFSDLDDPLSFSSINDEVTDLSSSYPLYNTPTNIGGVENEPYDSIYSTSVPIDNCLPYIFPLTSSVPKTYFLRSSLQESLENDKIVPEDTKQNIDNTIQKAERTFICMHSKRTFREDVLGYGISVFKHQKTNQVYKMSNSLDFLSYTAFYSEGATKSSTNEEFQFWLPLYINEEHGSRALKIMEESISMIVTQHKDKFEPLMILKVFPKLMSTMMVDVLLGKVVASDKALCGYLCFHRWMLHFASQYPSVLDNVNQIVNDFVSSPYYRHKDVVPSLGDFLPLLSLSDLGWNDVSKAYLTENFDRNILWVLRKEPKFLAANAISFTEEQIQQFFSIVNVGKHLVIFQVFFLTNIGRVEGHTLEHIAKEYDRTYGLSTTHNSDALRDFCKGVTNINCWSDFYRGIRVDIPTTSELSDILKNAIYNSRAKGYHDEASLKPKIYKKKRCWRFRKFGSCTYGDSCKFEHSEQLK